MLDRWRNERQGLTLGTMLLLVAGMVTACDYNDVDHLYISTGIGIDKVTDGIRVSVDIINPEASQSAQSDVGGSENQGPDRVVSAEGQTFEMAFSRIQSQLAHSLYLPHTAVVVFSKGAIASDLNNLVDALERNRQLRRSQLWVITPGNAEDILTTRRTVHQPTALVIRDLVDEASRRYTCLASDELHVVKRMLSPSSAASIAEVNRDREGNPTLSGMVLITSQGDMRRVSQAQILDASWMLGRTFDVRELVRLPSGASQSPATVTVHWLRTSTRFKLIRATPTPVIQVIWRGTGEIERWTVPTTITSQEFDLLEQAIQRDVEQRLLRAWKISTTSDIDAYGVQTLIDGVASHDIQNHRNSTDAWKRTTWVFDIRPQILHTELVSQTPLGSNSNHS
ncbi:Ger(x)C family spore germination protein [Alicyclobacillus acidocaldarius]|nr:Ger(x)C family spore germination C-terminal domain-containing protein [Alicyclobacillus acidocaldarius]